MEDNAKDIFNIRLTSDGITHILRFYKLLRWVLVLGILACIPAIIASIYGIIIIKAQPDLYKDYPLYRFYYLTYPYSWLFYLLVWIIQIFVYWKFGRVINKAIATLNEPDFNRSFVHLHTNARIVIVTICVSLLNNVLLLLVQLRY